MPPYIKEEVKSSVVITSDVTPTPVPQPPAPGTTAVDYDVTEPPQSPDVKTEAPPGAFWRNQTHDIPPPSVQPVRYGSAIPYVISTAAHTAISTAVPAPSYYDSTAPLNGPSSPDGKNYGPEPPFCPCPECCKLPQTSTPPHLPPPPYQAPPYLPPPYPAHPPLFPTPPDSPTGAGHSTSPTMVGTYPQFPPPPTQAPIYSLPSPHVSVTSYQHLGPPTEISSYTEMVSYVHPPSSYPPPPPPPGTSGGPLPPPPPPPPPANGPTTTAHQLMVYSPDGTPSRMLQPLRPNRPPYIFHAGEAGKYNSTSVTHNGRKQPFSISQAMELLWQGEFNRLFQAFLPHQWFLLPTAEPPNVNPATITPGNVVISTVPWKTFRDSAKVRFCCDRCGNGWTSMKGRVFSWFYVFPELNLGYVLFKLYGQQCKQCKCGQFEHAMWYPDEVVKVVNNLYQRVGQAYYGFVTPPLRIDRRKGKPKEQHNSDLCQACKDGLCKEELMFT